METSSVIVIGFICLGLILTVGMFFYLIEMRTEFKNEVSNLRQSLDRNEKIAAALSNQMETATAPKIHTRSKKNKVVRITDSERAQREWEESLKK